MSAYPFLKSLTSYKKFDKTIIKPKLKDNPIIWNMNQAIIKKTNNVFK